MTQRNVRGAYVNFEHDRQADWDWLSKWQPNVIRYMGPGSWSDPNSFDVNRVRRIHETCPDATILLRCWEVDDNNFKAHDAMVADPRGTAENQVAWWSRVFDRAVAVGVKASCLMAGLNNETGPEKDGALFEYTQWALDFGIQQAVPLGVFVFSVGRPSLPGEAEWTIDSFARLDNAILANKGAIVLHEYMQPEGMYAVWTDEDGNERKDYTYLIGRNLRWKIKSPIIIGEWGIDGILWNRHPDPEYGNSGWRNFKAEWPPQRYADEYVECVRKASDNVIGICPFLSDFSDHKWQSFDLLDAYEEFLARKDLCVREVSDTTPDTPPDTVHIPSVGTGTPVEGPTPVEPTPAAVPVLTHPIQDPALRIVSQAFGANPQEYARFGMAGHNGLDFAVPEGTPIVAVDDGAVVEVLEDTEGYGKYIKLRHVWGESLYAHLSVQNLLGGHIRKGGVIGRSGSTGNSTGTHLHFGMRVYPYKRGWPYDGYSDPSPYLQQTQSESPTDTTNVPQLIKAAAKEFGLEWQLIAALAWSESSFNPRAESKAGAKGLLQLMPPTWDEWSAKVGGTDIFDPAQNLRVGTAYLAWLIRYYKGDVYKAVIAYNFGVGNVDAGKKPPQGTIVYAERVLMGRDLIKALG